MDNSELIKAIDYFQNSNVFHELTCGTDSGHRSLYGVEQDGKVVLKCHDCDYTQTHMPVDMIVYVWENRADPKLLNPFL